MSKISASLVAAILVTQLSLAQETETTTYFGEKNGFQIDFPTDWIVSLTETKVMITEYSTIIIGYKENTPYAVVQVRVTLPCKNPESELKSFLSIFEKNAKKSNDTKFKIHDQGTGKVGDKDFSYVDYTYTLKGDNGSSSVVRRKFCTACHMVMGKPPRFSYSFYFEALESDWSKFSATYEKIFNSVKYKQK